MDDWRRQLINLPQSRAVANLTQQKALLQRPKRYLFCLSCLL
jgi:hypothetical protein